MYGEKRARQIEYKARKQRESLAGVSNTAPLNVQVRLPLYISFVRGQIITRSLLQIQRILSE